MFQRCQPINGVRASLIELESMAISAVSSSGDEDGSLPTPLQSSGQSNLRLMRTQRRGQGEGVVNLHGTPVPLGWLVAHKEDYPASSVLTPATLRRNERDARWSASREQLLAAGAAGIHLALFAYGLMFWGFEGMPQDRYWPANPRVKLQIRPGRYGNLEGSSRFYYDNLARLEGAD